MTMSRRMGFSLILSLAIAFAVGYSTRAWAIEIGAQSDGIAADIAAAPTAEEILEAQAAPAPEAEADLDPWEGWNEPMFRFNKRLDEVVLKRSEETTSELQSHSFISYALFC